MATHNNKRISFASTRPVPYPDFLDIQLKSFRDFFQIDTDVEDRKKEGLYQAFKENFPITDARNIFTLEFLDYSIGAPRYTMDECLERGLTYHVPLTAKLRLSCNDTEHEDFETITEDAYLGEIPYMTPSGTFIINGAERVVVSQLHRSPGVFFGFSYHTNGTPLYSARIIPFKGSWMEFTTDINNVMYAYIDRKKKLPVTTLLRAIGYETDKDILSIFDITQEVKATKANLKKFIGEKFAADVTKKWYEDFVDDETGEVSNIERTEVIINRETIFEKQHINMIADANIKTVLFHKKDDKMVDYSIIFNTLQKDPTKSGKEAIEYIYLQLKSTAAPDEETARATLEKLFFSEKRYDLGEVGRYRINKKLNLNIPKDTCVLTNEDIISIIRYLIELINAKTEVDDIDHLSNRRVRTVGEQLYNQFSLGLNRMARTIREKMNVRDHEMFAPTDLINSKTLSSVVNSFFGTNQLSQFMDQTNPLSEITHKRRISALGPGGLSRERAGFEVRDVHYTHYGRLCTIETPEGPNIGLISSLSVFAKINNLGFIVTPYRRVVNGQVQFNEQPIFLTAEEEDNMRIAQANTPMDENGLLGDKVKVRRLADYPILPREDVDLIDIAPNQIASIAASLIPFLENDDANRALMGSNMMRQAVPLLRPEAPIVGTGLEHQVAVDSRVVLVAEGNGVVTSVDATHIEIDYERSEAEALVSFDSNVKDYQLLKFRRTNQNSCINMRPIVVKGQKVKKGDVLTEGYATENGELALGRNLMVAFMPWKGYNFEDAVVISEKAVTDDLYTSIHIESFTMEVRDTKIGIEELTNDIPNVSTEATKDLNADGLIRVGAEVNEGDILIGKVTPKGESYPTPEEKLLRAIFGDKAGDVKDASLKAPPSMKGVVIGAKSMTRMGKDRKSRAKDKDITLAIEEKYKAELDSLHEKAVIKLYRILEGKQAIKDVYNYMDSGEVWIPKSGKFTQKLLQAVDFSKVSCGDWVNPKTDNGKTVNENVRTIIHNYMVKYRGIEARRIREINDATIGANLPSGIVQMAKVYIANARKLRIGDKMAGRHGNKGCVAKIVKQEDLPFLADGRPVDVVLNPLGVPSRMNLGQVYETVLAWAGKKMGCKFATPIFDGASLDQINEYMRQAGLPENGSTQLYDGETGEPFHQKATVGYIYYLKLHHMVDDKMHARSIGPYSLITQQPLGGKAQFGGQRFGEMEVWAIEAYGASNVLQEILTVKSDDVMGRSKAYEAIVKGDNMPVSGIPESFNVLVNELRGLALDIKFE
ncbi:MAG: DNA-directed RNA polymerase subunit beta [Bacteroidales bacterium]|nr:DNA-directed RNA polymerase subunit beta [Bacteroidales bacterium]